MTKNNNKQILQKKFNFINSILDQEILVPSTVDKSTETIPSNFENFKHYNENFQNCSSSPDSTTSSVCVKKEPCNIEECTRSNDPRKTTL